METLAQLSTYLFILFFVVWGITGYQTNKTNKQKSDTKSSPFYLIHAVIVGVAIYVNLTPLPGIWGKKLVQPNWYLSILGFLFLLLGISFAILARFYLGKNWSAQVQLREKQKLIKNGPYRIVRHPIYSGILFSVFGIFLMRTQIIGLLFLLLMIISYLIKISAEEKLMVIHFGEEYEEYQKKTYHLIPWIY